MHRSTRWLLALLLPALFLNACVCSTSGVNRGDVNLVSLDREWEMGRMLAQRLESEVRLADDPELQRLVEQIGQRLVAQTELAGREWQFHVVADSTVNAFALPGGHIYVNTGLVAAADSASELAGVLAHEVGHGIARHGTEQLTQAYGINAIANLVMGEDVGWVEQIVARVVGEGTLAKFSRDDEREADQLGLQYMSQAGYPPRAAAAIFETLLQQRQRRPNALEQFFASHPLTEERIQNVRDQAQQLPDRPRHTPNAALFAQAQQRAEAINARLDAPS